MNIDWYQDFVDLKYKPSKTDLVCLFRFEPSHKISRIEATGRIASESSAGTWTTLTRLPRTIREIMATSFEISGNFVKVAYPIDIWEPGNVPQLLSGIAGNIFGMKALENLRLVDVALPVQYLKHFRGPEFGIEGIRRILKVRKRPITGAVAKPKIGWSAEEHAEIAYKTWIGGFDLVKDDENLTSTQFNKFEQRVRLCSKMRDKAEKNSGERKSALINITGETGQMIKRVKMLHDFGLEYAMIDVVTVGMSALQTLREACHDYKMAIHAHRAMHASFDRNPRHGLSMLFLAKLCRMIGVDQLHIGTVIGKLVGTRHETLDIKDEIVRNYIRDKKSRMLGQNWHGLKPVFPVSSGGIHPGIIPDMLKMMGVDIVLLVSGGIHGHPNGTQDGARAAMQSIEAAMKNISLREYAKTHVELGAALEKWGHTRPQ